MAPKTANCPMCQCVHIVPMFDDDESDAQTCIACHGFFRFVITRDGSIGTRIDDSMVKPSQGGA